MSPYGFPLSVARLGVLSSDVFRVRGSDSPGYLNYNSVYATYGVRPKISLGYR